MTPRPPYFVLVKVTRVTKILGYNTRILRKIPLTLDFLPFSTSPTHTLSL